QGAQIVEFVNAILDAVIAIANGGTAGVPKMVEAALAASVPLLIGFLASLLGIGSLANKVKSVFRAVAKPVNRAIDKIINFIVKKGKALWNKLKGKGGEGGGGEEKSEGKKRNEQRAISESSKLLAKNPAKTDALDRISAIARRNKVPSLHLVTDSRTDQTERVHVQTMATPSYQLGPDDEDLTGPLREIFESLTSQDAKQQFDKFRKGAKSMETLEKTMLAKKRVAENLSQSMDEFLANEWRKGKEKREKEPPDASIIAKIEATLAEVVRVEKRIRGYSSAHPSVRGTERWLKVMTNQRTALEKAKLDKEKAKSVANIEEGYASYIRSVDAEVEAAENSRDVVEVGMPIRSEPVGKSDADVVADGGRTWKDSKDYLPFGLGSGNWEKLSIQVDRQLEIASDPAYTIGGRPPKLVYYFPRGVMQEVAEALEEKGVGVEGERISGPGDEASSDPSRDGGSG
ncbi:hypothetical protein ABZ622_37495, partial [Streptomyces sp. NPDC007164]